jgi:phage minor structural protein
MNEIRIAVLNPHDRVLAFLDNTHRNSMHYWSDELHEYLQGAANTYTFTVSSKHEDAVYIVEGNKVAFVYNGKDYYLNIVHVEKDEFTVTATAWSLSFELINENVGAYKSESAMSFGEYVTAFDPERTVRIGINEVSDKRISNEWTGEATVLSRLFSVANVFDAEIEFQTVLNDDYSLKEIVMNVYREHSDDNTGVGEFRGDIKLRYGKNVTGIRKESSIENLYTGIRPTGKDGLTIQGIEKEELDENGVVEFYTQGPDIRAPQARDRFPSNLINKEDGYIFMPKSYDTDNKDKLYSMALSDLKTASEPAVTYDVTGYFDTAIGDTVEIEDEEYVPTLYLSARVSEQVRSFTNPQANKTVFTNFKELQSEISEDLLQKVEDLINKTKIYTCSIATNNGIIFKNGIGSTTLTAYAYNNGVDVSGNLEIRWSKDGTEFYVGKSVTVNAEDVDVKAVYSFTAFESGVKRGYYEVTITDVMDGEDGQDGTTYYTWFKFADDKYGNGMSTSPDGKEYLGIAYNKVTPVMSNNPEDYQWARITGEGVPGKPGDDGKTYYTWVRYADDASGNGMSDSPNGKYYIGFAYNKEVPTESSNPADYQWSKYKGDDGKDGTDGAIKSETPPDDKTKLWYDTVNNVLKYWDGEKWVEAYTGDIEDAKDAAGNAQESANTAISSVNNINTSLEKYKNEVRAEFKNTVTYVNGKTEVIDTWVRQGSDGVTPFLELGGTSNDLKARLTNSRLGFYEGDKGLAYFGNEKAYMPVAEVDNLSAKRVGVGNYAMLDNGDGHLSLIYIE